MSWIHPLRSVGYGKREKERNRENKKVTESATERHKEKEGRSFEGFGGGRGGSRAGGGGRGKDYIDHWPFLRPNGPKNVPFLPMTLSSMYLSSFVVSSPFLEAIDLTGRGGASLWLPLVSVLGLTVLVVVVVDVVAVVDVDVDATAFGWPAKPAQLVLPVVGHVVSSARELILRCDPLQFLPHEIFTEQLILS